MGKSSIGSITQSDEPNDGIDQPISTQSPTKPKPRTRKSPRTPRTKPVITNEAKPIEETQVILDEVTSNAARENVDIRLKAANVESLPDESALIGGAAAMLVMLLDGIGMMAYGDFARLNDLERKMITEPLQHILAKMSPSSLVMIGKYADPVMLAMGLLTWISRVTMESKRREAAKKSPPSEEPEPIVVEPKPPEPIKAETELVTFPPDAIINNFQAAGNIL